MNKVLRTIVTWGMLLFIAYAPFRMNGQHLIVSGTGQLRPVIMGLVLCDDFLPQYKPLSKDVTITTYDLIKNSDNELKRRKYGIYTYDTPRTTNILYDREGRIIKITSSDSYSFKYENDRITESQMNQGEKFRYKYDSRGFLESATNGDYTYKYNVDKRGDIISVNEYYGAKKTSKEVSMSYDGNHRMITYHEVNDIWGTICREEYRWNYDKKGTLVSYRRSYYRNDKKNEEHEYKFEYGEDGNPIRCIEYLHGDITIIKGGYEYEYTYSFYLSPEELDSINYEDPVDIDYVDVRPSYPKGEYPNGEINFQIDFVKYMKWINASSAVKDLMKNGELVVGFIVETDGTVSNVKVIAKDGDFVDEEIERTILSMSKWEPGWIDGRKVRVAVSMPIKVNIQH